MKKFLAAAMAASMVLSMTACSDGKGTSDGGGEGLSGTIVYYSMWQETEPQADVIKNAIERFQNDNPDVEVEVEWQGRGVKDIIGPTIASGQQVDIFDSDPNGFYKGDTSILMNLDEFYASKGKNGKTEKENMLAGLEAWDIDNAKKAGLDGHYSVPYAPYALSWFYNTDMFADAGITKVPETWAELDEACAKLKAKGYEPIVTDDAYMDLMFDYYLAREMGPEAVTEMVKTGKDAYNNEHLLNALKAMEDFANKGYFAESIKTNKYPAGQQQFARKEAAMYFNASFMASENAETAGEDFPYGHFAYPTVEGGAGAITENTIGGQGYMVNAKTENKEAVFELMHYLLADECQNEFLEKGLVPCVNSVEWPAPVKDQKEIVTNITKNINWGADISGDFADAILKPTVTEVMLGETSAQDAFDKIVSEAQNYN